MLSVFEHDLAALQSAPVSIGPSRFGRVHSCDGGLIEVSGLPVPIGTLCRVMTDGPQDDPKAEVIGFRDRFSLMMLLGDSVLLHPGARVRAEGEPGMVAVGEAFLGRAVDATGHPIDGGPPIRAAARWPLVGIRESALERASVVEPFDCGVRAMNALTTMGTAPGELPRRSSPANWRIPITSRPSRFSTVSRSSASCDPVATALTGARATTSTSTSAPTSIAAKLVRPKRFSAACADAASTL